MSNEERPWNGGECPAVPEGWKLVPVEPTEEMVEHGAREVDWYEHNARDCYEAMLAAAPEPSGKPATRTGGETMMERITKYGEIMRDTDTLEYVVWDEIYVNEVCRTPYLPLAEYAHRWYCENLLVEPSCSKEESKA